MREALRLYRLSEQNDSASQFWLGVRYEEGNGVREDMQEAMRWYRLAAEQNDDDAQARVAEWCESGQGTEKYWQETVRWYRLMAER